MVEVTMADADFYQLQPIHEDYLKSKGYWENIIANRNAGRK